MMLKFHASQEIWEQEQSLGARVLRGTPTETGRTCKLRVIPAEHEHVSLSTLVFNFNQCGFTFKWYCLTNY